MSKNYSDLAQSIIKLVGGKENIRNLIHCQTRLRFDLTDESKVKVQELQKLAGVAGVINSGGQFQVVIGTHVSEVYEEVASLLGDVEEMAGKDVGKKKNFLSLAIEFISTSFSPIIPAMSGAGMIKALLALLVLFNLVSNESQTYYIINFMADAVFYFLPFFLANTAARKLKCNPYLAMALAGVLLHPNFAALITAGEPVNLFSMPVRLVGYGASVIPILLIVICQSFIEKFFNKIIPNAVKIVFVPMLTILITGVIALVAVGPLGSYVGEFIAAGFNAIRAAAPWAPAVIVGTLLPIMVMFGIHTSIGPLDVLQLTSVGYANIFGPGAMVSNIATGVAALVASTRTKDQKEKQVATSGGITALMGITEPALYGVALPKKYPLIATMIGGGVGGLYAGLSGASRFATGSSGLPAIPLYIGENISNVVNILIAIAITMITTAVATYLLSIRFEKDTSNETTSESVIAVDSIAINSPIIGEMLDLSEVKDEAFSKGMLGKGVAFEPSEGKVVAPFNGTVATLFPTKHAIGLVCENGVELLIHIGLNTVDLNGKYFEAHVRQGDKVIQGQTLITFDLEKLRAEGYVTQIPVVVTNTANFKEVSHDAYGTKNSENTMLTIQV
ncbi:MULTISPECIES: beta-glucoside-specific PTS transporter subunit IIABC [Enterococcus]|uniref:PTS system sucrose-specific EIIBCA component n=1 Tax=Enterococcus raffinosus TaxID=71452 RepID=A0AAP5KFH6_9ENTE|nr:MULTISPECIES: beta-glucoside-specific PTS transporter subunit IIABC [Enterococcus]SAZ80926.1 PTS system beta-glucoside-specific transporter subunit IIABC [Enterococcus faecium]MDK7991221.1 beta-glucoside-specific PTS transporter subunit IIABC [Enterococcus raffinosus]MDT2524455.1 beta-glucoside-specific PTS transporter subunit IIABC [Enterococcus raffinosus]MDT2535141.1 beta-glucoside-specific PTS transporter subunit IIABC [Enterococcus raffinosus]MDT2536602.1 beta-glucoside-specific PTS tr